MMKSTGIVRKVDELGRIVLPVECRRVMEIEDKDALEVFVEDNTIILKKYEPACIFCGSPGTWSRSRGATSAPSARKAWPNGMPTTEKSIAKEGEATLPPLFLVGGLDFGQPFRMITVL